MPPTKHVYLHQSSHIFTKHVHLRKGLKILTVFLMFWRSFGDLVDFGLNLCVHQRYGFQLQFQCPKDNVFNSVFRADLGFRAPNVSLLSRQSWPLTIMTRLWPNDKITRTPSIPSPLSWSFSFDHITTLGGAFRDFSRDPCPWVPQLTSDQWP